MKNNTLTQQFVLIGLNGLGSKQTSLAKSAVIRALPFAGLLERKLPVWERQTPEALSQELEACLGKVKKMSRKEAQSLEQEATAELVDSGAMEIIPDILECDMNYESAGVEIKSYRSDESVYQSIAEGMRAEVLEEGPLTTECVCLLWLFRESCGLHDLFTVSEQNKLAERMLDITSSEPVYRVIWQTEFHSVLESFALSYLRAKKNLFRNPYLEGINLVYPFLERRQAIFVDLVIPGTNVKDRRLAVMRCLQERGHRVQEVKSGSETLLKIDNCYYRIFPKTKSSHGIPIQGVCIAPVYL